MTKHTYYKFLNKYHLAASESSFDEKGQRVFTNIDSLEHTSTGACINGVDSPYSVINTYNRIYRHCVLISPQSHEGGPGRTPSMRVQGQVAYVCDWITTLIMEDKILPLDDFDIDPSRKQKIVLGAAIKYASHSVPLEELLWRPGTGIVRDLLSVVIPTAKDAVGMTKEEVKEFLNIHRTGERANWWFLYQVLIRHECVDVLDEAPKRTLVEYRDDGMMLTIPAPYPNATTLVKNPGSRVWDPF